MKKQTILAAFLLLLSLHLNAQEKWTVELRPQLSFPTQQPELFDFQTGYGFDAMLSYNFMPQLGVYAGWG
ncbi:MAG: opacity protein, partial [Salinimicrobium sp.]